MKALIQPVECVGRRMQPPSMSSQNVKHFGELEDTFSMKLNYQIPLTGPFVRSPDSLGNHLLVSCWTSMGRETMFLGVGKIPKLGYLCQAYTTHVCAWPPLQTNKQT